MKTTHLLFLLLITSTLFGQTDFQSKSDLKFVYKITNEQAIDLAKADFKEKDLRKIFQDADYFSVLQPIDTLREDEEVPTYPNGHYIVVSVIRDYVDYDMFSFNNIGIIPIADKRKFKFHLVDSLGNYIKADKVKCNGRTIRYNAKKQYYQGNRFYNDRLLIIENGNDVAVYDVEAESWLHSWTNRFEHWNIGQKWSNLFNKKTKTTYGYITTNKPRYLPQDTVKIKAYIANKRGKPYNIPLKLSITRSDEYRFETVVQPTTKGSYIFDFPIGDSLILDKDYYVTFWDDETQLIQTYFRYEDYQLDEVTYQLRSEKNSFKQNEPITFYVSGQNANGQHTLDSEVEILAKPGRIDAFHDKKILVPDTLFYYKGDLEINDLERKKMRFTIPKFAIPKADFTIYVVAKFTNANGELHEKTIDFQIKSDTTFIDIRMNSDTLQIDYTVNGRSIPKIGILEFSLDDTEFYFEEKITLPYKKIINPVFEEVMVDIDGEKRGLALGSYYHGNKNLKRPRFSLWQEEDSVFVYGNNPSRLTITYSIYRGNRKITTITTKDKKIRWKGKNRNGIGYRIDYEYVMNGKGQFRSRNFRYAKNRLFIDIEQPDVIQPGETVDVKIKVRNRKDKNMKNVNMVAGAVNEQFGYIYNRKYQVPVLGKQGKVKSDNSYSYRSIDDWCDYSPYEFIFWRDKITPKNREIFQLDSLLYYQLLMPDNGYFEQSLDIESDDKYAQFAPFIVKNNHFQPVYLIYANRRLVYYYDTESPYSFQAFQGYNNIVIRGYDFELEIDSVYLKKGQKLVFSIDLNNLPKNATLTPKKNEWTSAEIALLNQSIFRYKTEYKKQTIHIYQDDIVYNYQQLSNKAVVNFGPFMPNRDLTLIRKNGFKNTFLFEVGYEYSIAENRERLYHDAIFPKDEKAEIPWRKPYVLLNDTLSFNKNIPVFDKKERIHDRVFEMLSITPNKWFKRDYQSVNYQIQKKLSAQTDSTIHAYLFYNKTTKRPYLFEGKRTSFANIPKGNYAFYGYTIWGHYFEKNIQIKNDTLTYEYLEGIDFQLDSGLVLIKNLLGIAKEKVIGSKYEEKKQFPYRITKGITSVSGKLTNYLGEPLMFGTIVLIKNNKIITGVQTDIDGKYQITDLEPGTYDLEVSYVGYSSKRIQGLVLFKDKSITINVEMMQGIHLETITVSYQVPLVEQDNTTQGTVITTKEMEKLASKNINGIVAQAAGVSSTDNDERVTIRGSRSNAKDYYIDGIRVSGSMIPQSEIEQVSINDLAIPDQSYIRSNFKDYAFWQPNLMTDENGEATFRVTYPDNITAYQTFVMGMDKRRNFGTTTKTVKSQKSTLAQLAVPRFLIEGDKTNIIGKALNYTNDSLRIKSSFLSENNILESNDFWLDNAKIETTQVIANTRKDTLLLAYKIENSKFLDGEKRPIPIYKKGVEETVGTFHVLDSDTTLLLSFDQQKGNVKLYAQTDVLNVLLEDIQYLIDYPYGCNEQTASRLLALLMNDKIRKLTDKTYTNSKTATKNKQLILKMINRLEKAQNPNGSWGWWTGNSTNYWMTNYVIKALYEADIAGYKSGSFELGLRFLTNSLSQMKGRNLLNAIELLSDIQQNLNYEKYLIQLDSTIRYNDYFSQLQMTKIKQQQGLQYDLKVLDTLENQTLFGNVFYKNKKYDYWYANQYNLTTMAYEIIKKENPNDKRLAKIRGYFLEKRTRQGWQNTFTTAQILATILPDMMIGNGIEKPKLIIKGSGTQTVTEFPFETTFYSNQPIEIEKIGTSTIYLTAYQQFWNDKPKPKSDVFELKSKLVQNDKTVKKLEAKTPAKMVVTLDVTKEAEYVMVEVPIPAGCSYGEKSRGYGYWYGREVHREYFREKTCVFYQNLPVGTYTIEINLEPRFTGEYTINPAKAEEMYFPVFYGRNAIKEVEIVD